MHTLLKNNVWTAIAMIGTSQMMEQVDLKVVVSSTALAGNLAFDIVRRTS